MVGPLQRNAVRTVLCLHQTSRRTAVVVELTNFGPETLFEDFQVSMHVSRAALGSKPCCRALPENFFDALSDGRCSPNFTCIHM